MLKGNEELAKNLKDELVQSKAAAEAKFKVYYDQVLSQTNLLSDKYTEIVNDESVKFENKLKKATERIQVSTKVPALFFDFKAATLGLVASGVSAGEFAAVAAGITSNLGLYILVAQVGGALTSAGIISSPIIATTTVAALGGPVAWLIGISAILDTTIYGIFHRNAWKGKLAKSIIEGYEKQDGLSQYLNGIDTFIKDTEQSIDNLKQGLDLAAEKDVELSKLRSEDDYDL